jgi:hypothetical protein
MVFGMVITNLLFGLSQQKQENGHTLVDQINRIEGLMDNAVYIGHLIGQRTRSRRILHVGDLFRQHQMDIRLCMRMGHRIIY